MTFTDKKIEEFSNKFEIDCSLVEKKARISTSGLLSLRCWLRKALAEVERKAKWQSYADIYTYFEATIQCYPKFDKYMEQKLKELERE